MVLLLERYCSLDGIAPWLWLWLLLLFLGGDGSILVFVVVVRKVFCL